MSGAKIIAVGGILAACVSAFGPLVLSDSAALQTSGAVMLIANLLCLFDTKKESKRG